MREREILRDALDASITAVALRSELDPDVAEFAAYIPNGGVKTNRDNEWVLTLHVAWDDRHEISRVVETIPMTVSVRIRRAD